MYFEICSTFSVMGEVIWVRAMAGFVHQDYVKLIGNGGAHNHNCAFRLLSILITGLITTFSSASLSTCLNLKN